MSSNEVILNNGQQAIINTDTSKIFIWNNRYKKGNYTNSTYDPETILAGRLMGRVAATQELVKHVASASDGSQFPIGVLAHDVTIEDGDTVELTICDAGDIPENKIILQTGNDLDTVISSQSIRDRIKYLGINLVPSTEMTEYDNQ
jgi:hypothetical protein